jgi:FkbM family methyltransferase
MPKILARYFGEVYTFEPALENFACLERNVDEPNICIFPHALGESSGSAGLVDAPDNCGQSHIADGHGVRIISIDSLELEACDLIQLDVEGYELSALKGAAETIAKYSPVIAIEENGLSERYGIPRGAALDWLADIGYGVVGMHGRDFILCKQ